MDRKKIAIIGDAIEETREKLLPIIGIENEEKLNDLFGIIIHRLTYQSNEVINSILSDIEGQVTNGEEIQYDEILKMANTIREQNNVIRQMAKDLKIESEIQKILAKCKEVEEISDSNENKSNQERRKETRKSELDIRIEGKLGEKIKKQVSSIESCEGQIKRNIKNLLYDIKELKNINWESTEIETTNNDSMIYMKIQTNREKLEKLRGQLVAMAKEFGIEMPILDGPEKPEEKVTEQKVQNNGDQKKQKEREDVIKMKKSQTLSFAEAVKDIYIGKNPQVGELTTADKIFIANSTWEQIKRRYGDRLPKMSEEQERLFDESIKFMAKRDGYYLDPKSEYRQTILLINKFGTKYIEDKSKIEDLKNSTFLRDCRNDADFNNRVLLLFKLAKMSPEDIEKVAKAHNSELLKKVTHYKAPMTPEEIKRAQQNELEEIEKTIARIDKEYEKSAMPGDVREKLKELGRRKAELTGILALDGIYARAEANAQARAKTQTEIDTQSKIDEKVEDKTNAQHETGTQPKAETQVETDTKVSQPNNPISTSKPTKPDNFDWKGPVAKIVVKGNKMFVNGKEMVYDTNSKWCTIDEIEEIFAENLKTPLFGESLKKMQEELFTDKNIKLDRNIIFGIMSASLENGEYTKTSSEKAKDWIFKYLEYQYGYYEKGSIFNNLEITYKWPSIGMFKYLAQNFRVKIAKFMQGAFKNKPALEAGEKIEAKEEEETETVGKPENEKPEQPIKEEPVNEQSAKGTQVNAQEEKEQPVKEQKSEKSFVEKVEPTTPELLNKMIDDYLKNQGLDSEGQDEPEGR